MTLKASAKKNADSYAKWRMICDNQLVGTTFEGSSTHYNASVIPSSTFVPIGDTSLSNELIDERIDDQSRKRFRKLYQENDE